MTAELEALREPFARWLAARWPDAEDLSVGVPVSPKSGFSAQTLFVPVRFRRGGEDLEERVVLRIESSEPAIYPQQAPGLDVEIEIQFRAMQAVSRHSKAPFAPLYGYEPDASVLGAPFFAMGYVAGEVPIENPAYTQEGFFLTASPEQRRRMLEDGLRVLAEIHTVDWRSAGLDWLVPPGATPGVQRQLDLWEVYARRELQDRIHPGLERGFAWLRANLPEGLEPGLSWGDSRPGNIIWQDFRCACVTDWENVSIAPTQLDLGWWLMFDRCSHEVVGVPRLPGEPTREEQRQHYFACAGLDAFDTHYFEMFGAMRYAAVVVRVMNRAVERDFIPEHHTIWLENPASSCLEQLLERCA